MPTSSRLLQHREAIGGDQRGRAASQHQVGSAGAVLRRVGADRHGTAFDQEQADAGFVAVGPGQACRHDEGVGLVSGRHHRLAATERVAAAGRGGACGHLVQPVARLVFLVGQHHQGRAIGHLRQPGGLQRGGRGRQQRRRHQRGVGIGCVDQATAQLFHHHHGLDRTKTHAALRFGNRQPRQAQFGQFGVHAARAATGLGQRMATVEGKALVDPAGHGVTQRELVVGEFEVHGVQLPKTNCETMLRWTSLDPP
jgi:hypothetical protein